MCVPWQVRNDRIAHFAVRPSFFRVKKSFFRAESKDSVSHFMYTQIANNRRSILPPLKTIDWEKIWFLPINTKLYGSSGA